MTQEEKAKRYDEAIERYKAKQECESQKVHEFIEYLFPELKESEDERIRKELLNYLYDVHDDDEERARWIAWLEKQGEQKPADKVEPKFHEGDWVVSPNGVYWHIDKISNNRYEVTSNTGESSNWPLDTKIYHRFTIQDAKDGDVLNSVRVQATIIFKGFADDGKHILAYCALQKGFFLPQELPWDRDFEPVSEYWKNALYDAMTAKGYEWNAEKKELRKIEQKPIDDVKVLNQEFWRGYKYGEEQRFGKYADCNIEEMPVEWSEEDEGWLDNAIVSCEQCGNTDTADWLKSLKDRVQPKQEWSEEDESCLITIINELEASKSVSKYETKTYDKLLNWLKSLRPQKKQEWSKDDEILLEGIIGAVSNKKLLNKYQIEWLSNLSPQSHWKPSEEQIKSLKWLLDKIIYYPIGGHSILVVQKLLEQLKAL